MRAAMARLEQQQNRKGIERLSAEIEKYKQLIQEKQAEVGWLLRVLVRSCVALEI